MSGIDLFSLVLYVWYSLIIFYWLMDKIFYKSNCTHQKQQEKQKDGLKNPHHDWR